MAGLDRGAPVALGLRGPSLPRPDLERVKTELVGGGTSRNREPSCLYIDGIARLCEAGPYQQRHPIPRRPPFFLPARPPACLPAFNSPLPSSLAATSGLFSIRCLLLVRVEASTDPSCSWLRASSRPGKARGVVAVGGGGGASLPQSAAVVRGKLVLEWR